MTFTPYEKMNKKQRAAIDKQRRTFWDCKPTMRIVPSAKIYNRKKVKYSDCL